MVKIASKKTSVKPANSNISGVKKAAVKHRDFIDISDLSETELRKILDFAGDIKAKQKTSGHPRYLSGKQLAMIFEKESTRTRVSFEVGINQLGGNAIFISGSQSQMGRGEPIKDTASVLSRYVDIIMIRTFRHENIKELAEYSKAPVINGLTDYSHPCQIMADIMTAEEQLGNIKKQKVAWLGDYNNVCRSWIHAAEIFGFQLNIATPEKLKNESFKSKFVKFFVKPEQAVKDATIVTTDTWVSMGEEKQDKEKKKLLKPYQVNQKLFSLADKKAIFLHCLPAHRGEEVTEDVIDGKRSFIYDEAENRLHAQKAIMCWCLNVI